MTSILYVFLAILILGVCIFVHEFGHYLAARTCGLTVVEFAVGMGPAIFKWRRKDIDYSIRALPIGGFCSFVGENPDDDAVDPRNINLQPAWKRVVMTVAGPIMNGLLALITATALVWYNGVYTVVNRIEVVSDGTPAQTAGLLPGDEIVGVDGIMYATAEEISSAIAATGANDVTLTIERDAQRFDVTVAKQYDAQSDRYLMGINFGVEFHRVSIFRAMKNSFAYCFELLKSMVQTLGQMFTNKQIMDSIAGPVGTVSLVTEYTKASFEQSFADGIYMVFSMLIIISMNLGLMNLLPLPALDGCRAVLLAIEAVTGKHLSRKAEAIVHFVGLILLLGLIVLITGRDILRLFGVNV